MKTVAIIVTGSRSVAQHPKRDAIEQQVHAQLRQWMAAVRELKSVHGENPKIFLVTGDAVGIDAFARRFFELEQSAHGLMVYRLDGTCEATLRSGTKKIFPWIAAERVERSAKFPLVRNTAMLARTLVMDRPYYAAFKDPASKTGGTDQTIRAARDMLINGDTFVLNEHGGFDRKD